MTFSAEFRPYIGVGTLTPRPTALGGLLPPRATAIRPDAVARGARPLTPRRGALCLGHARGPLPAAHSVVAHDVMFLTPRDGNGYPKPEYPTGLPDKETGMELYFNPRVHKWETSCTHRVSGCGCGFILPIPAYPQVK
jgi:hypothetical protein